MLKAISDYTIYFKNYASEYLYSEGPVLGIATLVALWLGYKITRRLVRRFLLAKAYKEENVQHFLFVYRYAWLGTGFVFALISFSGSIEALGISAAFLGMILGWSLQAPVTGIAAWLMIILKQPFKIGDRVIISGIIGDVVDINLTHVLLNQVGGTIGGEEKSGRGVLIPNATLFGQIIYNYTLEEFGGKASNARTENYILDEVPIRISHQSNFDEAEGIFIAAAKDVTASIISNCGQEPFVRAELFDSGIMVRLRYQTQAKDRQRISSDIVRQVIRGITASEKVEFAYPHMNLYHSPKGQTNGEIRAVADITE
ncbi:MAG: small-conductance mechanosensitive channel [Candidatus Latescibacterota bacterium]